MKDKIKSKMVWAGDNSIIEGGYLSVSGAKFGFIHSVKGGKWLVVLVFLGSGEIRGPFDTEEQAKEAAEQAVIDWFERVLK